MAKILVLYYSHKGSVEKLASLIGDGIESVADCEAIIRTVPSVSPNNEQSEPQIPVKGHLYCSEEDLASCDGLVLGSPTRFGNMAAPLKYFIDGTLNTWLTGSLIDKPFSVFTSSGSLHGGQESTLLTMAIPLIHHGMVYLGLPYSNPDLNHTQTGGTPYGASHYAGINGDTEISSHEEKLCFAQGKRIAEIALKLSPR